MGSIRTKDGIEITGIPDNMASNDPILKQIVQSHRQTAGPGTYSFRESAVWMQQQQPESVPVARVDDRPMDTTDVAGLAGAGTRGAGPIAAGALLGAGLGAPFAGVGAVPGAIAGAGITGVVIPALDTVVSGVNSLLGTKYTSPTDAFNDLFTRLGVAEPDSAAENILQSIAQGAAAGGAGAAGGQTLQQFAKSPTARGVGQVLGEGVPQQILGGAGAAGGQAIAEEAGAGPGAQIAASLAGGLAGGQLGRVRGAGLPQAPIEEAERAGVQLMTSDVRPPKTFAGRWLQSMSEKIPIFGTGGQRAQQQTQRVEAVKDIVQQYGAEDMSNIPANIVDDLFATKSANLTKWSGAKNEVIERLSSTIDDVPPAKVPMNNTLSAIDDQIASLQSLNTQEVQPAIDRLTDWRTAVQDQDLSNIETLRKQLGESFKAPELASVRTTAQKSLNSIYGAVKQDMTDYITEVGGAADVNKWQIANRNLSELIKEADTAKLKKIFNQGEATPEIINTMLFNKDKTTVQRLYNQLSDSGRSSARSAVIAKAAEQAGGEQLSPDRFANAVKKMGNQTGVFFKDNELDQVEGLVRVLDASKRAGQAGVMTPTGMQNIPVVGAAAAASYFGGGMEGMMKALAAGTAAGGAARIYESRPIRNILAKIPLTTVGSVEEAALFKRLIEVARAVQSNAKKEGVE